MGYGSALLAQDASSVIGFDYSEEAIEDARSNYGISEKLEFRVGNLEEHDFSVPACDVVVLFEVIEHLKSPGPLLKKVADAIRPGGVFLFSTPNFRRHSREGERHNEHHHHDYREEDLSSILAPHFEHVVVLPQSVLIASSIGSEPQVADLGGVTTEDHMFLVGVAPTSHSLMFTVRSESNQIGSPPLLSVKLREERTAKEAHKARAIESAAVVSRSAERVTRLESEIETLRRNEQRALAEAVHVAEQLANSRGELEKANSAVDQLRAQAERQNVRISAIEAKRKKAGSELAAQRAKYARLRNPPLSSFRVGGSLEAVFPAPDSGSPPALIVWPPSGPSFRPYAPKPAVPRRTEQSLVSELRRLRPAGDPVDSGLVSIIVPTRDGLHHMERLISGLRLRTDYPSFELIVVDNASSDGTVEWLSGVADLTVSVIQNSRNESFSACL